MTEKQGLPTSEHEIELLQKIFKGNDHLLKSIRCLFFGFYVSEADKKIIKETFSDSEVKEVFRKKFYPIISPDSNLGEETDFWLGTETQIFGQPEGVVYQAIASKEKVAAKLKTAFALLDDPDGETVDLSFTANFQMDPMGVNLLSRNMFIKTIATGLLFTKLAAEQKNESPKALKARVEKDSSK